MPTLGQVEVQKAGSADFERQPLDDTATYSLALSAYIASGEVIATLLLLNCYLIATQVPITLAGRYVP